LHDGANATEARICDFLRAGLIRRDMVRYGGARHELRRFRAHKMLYVRVLPFFDAFFVFFFIIFMLFVASFVFFSLIYAFSI